MKNYLAIVMALGAFATIASADTFNCTSVTSPTELNASISCPDYNGGGTLTGITITLTGTITGSITLTNAATTNETVTGTTTSAFYAGAVAGFTGASPLFTDNFTTGAVTLTPGQSETFANLMSGMGSGELMDTTQFAAYTGAGTFSVPVTTISGFSLTGGGGQVGSLQTTFASATATVTYDVAGAPEPGTMVLGLTGLAGVAISLLRRRKINS